MLTILFLGNGVIASYSNIIFELTVKVRYNENVYFSMQEEPPKFFLGGLLNFRGARPPQGGAVQNHVGVLKNQCTSVPTL